MFETMSIVDSSGNVTAPISTSTITASGSTTLGDAGTDTLTFAAFPTLGVLDAAVTALGKGWTGTASGTYEDTPSTQLLVSMGQDCLNASSELLIPYQPISGYETYANRGEVYYASGFYGGIRNVIVDYTAGYETIPLDLELAALRLLSITYRESQSDPTMKSEKIGDYNYTKADAGLEGTLGLTYTLMKTVCAKFVRQFVVGVT